MEILGHVECSGLRIAQFTDIHIFPRDAEVFVTKGRSIPLVQPEEPLSPPIIKPDVEVQSPNSPSGYEQHIVPLHVRLIRKVVNRVHPDFVVFTGDIVDGRGFQDRDPSSWREEFLALIQPLLKHQPPIPWTFTPGNHDDDGAPWQRQDLLAVYDLPMCASKGAKTFNHTFTIGRKWREEELEQEHGQGLKKVSQEPPNSTGDLVYKCQVRLWLFDSGGNHPILKYDPFSVEAVRAFSLLTGVQDAPSSSPSSPDLERGLQESSRDPENQSDSLSGPCVLSQSIVELAYFHIPLPEYGGLRELRGTQGLFDAALASELVPNPWNKIPFIVRLLGKHRVVGCSVKNTGLFQAMRASGRVKATFCGHDHYNDFVAERDGVFLCYGRVSGFTPPCNWEGDGGPLRFAEGARIVEVDGETGRTETWIETMYEEEAGTRIELNKDRVYNERMASRLRWAVCSLSLLALCGLGLYLHTARAGSDTHSRPGRTLQRG